MENKEIQSVIKSKSPSCKGNPEYSFKKKNDCKVKLHMNLKSIIYSFFDFKTLANHISLLSKADRD